MGPFWQFMVPMLLIPTAKEVSATKLKPTLDSKYKITPFLFFRNFEGMSEYATNEMFSNNATE